MRPAFSARLAALLLVAAAGPAVAQTWRTVTSARQHQGERELDVEISYAAGRFVLSPAPAGTLYRMVLRYDEDRVEPVRQYDSAAGTLRLGVRGRGGMRVRLGDSRGVPPPALSVTLAPDVALALDIQLGAAEAEVELGGLALRRVRYRTGASETRLRFSTPNPAQCDLLELEAGAAEFRALQLGNANCRRLSFDGGVGEVLLDFSGAWRRSMEADVDVGIGELTLRLPRDVGVMLRLSRFLASFDHSGFVRRDNAYYSANYDHAAQRLHLDVNAAIGGVQVRWVDSR